MARVRINAKKLMVLLQAKNHLKLQWKRMSVK